MLPSRPFFLSLCCIVALASASNIAFYDSFDETWEGRWIPSSKDDYQGTWKHSKSDGHEDFGLLVTEKAKKYALVTELSEKMDFTDTPVVLQYDVRLHNRLECGGAYLKFLTAQAPSWTPQQFDNESPYSIMFGPDKCGSTNKVHFIFRHKHPKTNEIIEHHLKHPPVPVIDKLSHVYTAIVYPNSSVSILVDGVVKKTANLLSDDFEPPVVPPKTIADPEDKKPEDWDEEPTIPDPEATKPEDWDEDAPMEIEDVDAVKPDGWLDDEPEEIDDPEAEKPEDWDDEEDGEWEPLKIPNPKCEEAPGCGEWTRPTKTNPKYVGKWFPPQITNPNYKGVWKPREISNPDYFELEKLNLEPIAAIGIEIWTMQDGILFDNILIAREEAIGEEYREKTWKVKYETEKKSQKEDEDEVEEQDDEDNDATTTRLTALQSHVFKLLYGIPNLPFLGAYKETLTGIIKKGETKPALVLSVLGGFLVVLLTSILKVVLGGKQSKKSAPLKEGNEKENLTSTPTPESNNCDEAVENEKEEEAVVAEDGEKAEGDDVGEEEEAQEEEKREADEGEAQEEVTGTRQRKARTET